MTLASPETIRLLLATQKDLGEVRLRRDTSVTARPVTGGRRRSCKCGRCRECVDNARWERIFAAKFADPTYYDRPLVSVGSPLTSL